MEQPAQSQRSRGWIVPATSWPYLLLFAAALFYAGLSHWGSPVTPPVIVTDGAYVVALLIAAAGWGAFPTRWLAGNRVTAAQEFAIATALGLGIVGYLTLLLGSAGLLSRPVCIALLAVGAAVGFARLLMLSDSQRTLKNALPPQPTTFEKFAPYIVAALLVWPLGMLLFTVTLPPGVLWTPEGGGYDVLEYHLQVPREYFDAGLIHFLPHNVYASFPQQVEILYLLLMHLFDDPYAAAIPAQILHAALGGLAVFAIAVFVPAGVPRALTILLAASVPWLVYLGALAYVELGMLYFSAVAAGLLWQLLKSSEFDWKLAAAAGICGGLAAGCKYTAIVLICGGLALAFLVASQWPLKKRFIAVSVFAAAALATFSPWLIRNAAFTGNPVFPFAYEWFGGAAWSAEQNEQWKTGHEAKLPEGHIVAAWDELFASRLFGPTLFIAAVAAWLTRRNRVSLFFGVWSLAMVATWMLLTHMPGRFIVPIIVPLALAAGHGLEQIRSRTGWQVALLGLLGVGTIWNASYVGDLLQKEEAKFSRQTNFKLAQSVDATTTFITARPENALKVDDKPGKPLLIGDAAVFYVAPPVLYNVVFNRDPWLTLQEQGGTTADAVQWLRDNDITHVVIDWSEVKRLRDTYGFSEIVTPAWRDELIAAGLEPCCEAIFAPYGGRREALAVPQ